MKKDEFLDLLIQNLDLPAEYRDDIVDELQSHIFEAKLDNKDVSKIMGNPTKIAMRMSKAKKVTVLSLLALRSTWIQVVDLVCTNIVSGVVAILLSLTVIQWALVIIGNLQIMSGAQSQSGSGPFGLLVMVLILMIIFSTLIILANFRFFTKAKFLKQNLLSFVIAGLITLILVTIAASSFASILGFSMFDTLPLVLFGGLIIFSGLWKFAQLFRKNKLKIIHKS